MSKQQSELVVGGYEFNFCGITSLSPVIIHRLLWLVVSDNCELGPLINIFGNAQTIVRNTFKSDSGLCFAIGQQNLAFGLKFKAKGIVDVYENELEILPLGIQRDIDFKMVEGDFQVFEGKWRIEQVRYTYSGNFTFSILSLYFARELLTHL
eukprot:Gb_11319 [translate_table: standard]